MSFPQATVTGSPRVPEAGENAPAAAKPPPAGFCGSVACVKGWLWVSALASVAGWTLSALGQLNTAGYLVSFGAALLVVWFLKPPLKQACSFNFQKLRRRFSRPWPLIFAAFAALVLLGGILYAPTNHAGLTYRTPRVLSWLMEGHWFWIHTANYRMNDRTCGFEWLTAPLLLFTRSDRTLFLLNFIPFLLLPGLIFSVFTRLGVCARVAWHWMWLLPTGYNFLLQAGSIANDTFPAVYALAAVDFALRAWSSRRVSDLWYSLLAAALLTGAKPSNLPLLLPWFIIFAPLFPLLRKRWVVGLSVSAVAALVSFLPTAFLNSLYCGDWSGLALERTGMDMKNLVVGVWGNALLFLLHNFVPPFLPAAGWWNANILNILPQGITIPLTSNFELGFHTLWELPTEDWAGLGFGLSFLLLVSVFAATMLKRRPPPVLESLSVPKPIRVGALACAWLALLAYCVKSGMVTGARIISPYYALLVPALLLGPAQLDVVRRRWWKTLAWLAAGLALLVLVVTPARPLWPALTLLSKLQKSTPNRRLVQRAFTVYDVYRHRSDPLAQVTHALPPELTTVGFLADGDDLSISLWRPYFRRRVEYILPDDSAQQLRKRGIEYAVVGGAYLAANGLDFGKWTSQVGAQEVWQGTITLKVAEGPQPWHIVRLANLP